MGTEHVVHMAWLARATDACARGAAPPARRGGQVVLPHLWKSAGSSTPPAIVINGGCAMKLPEAPCWPDEATTFLLIGGRDTFRGKFSPEGYVADAKARVPAGNFSTALLFVSEMESTCRSPPCCARCCGLPSGACCCGRRAAGRPSTTSGSFWGFSGVLAYTKREGRCRTSPSAPGGRRVPRRPGAPRGPCGRGRWAAREAVPPLPWVLVAPLEELASHAVEAACSVARSQQTQAPVVGLVGTVLGTPGMAASSASGGRAQRVA
ncbi:unnamed protein product [Prorocentrum cordatum]|uniref:Uncharacterized protein n=1 Tax=Prorocentrum cordatum TaxID=2364126 RepID=A0ABN9YBY8_9DINO|nr:unnamed protein product [Polarella glacialis]